MHGFSAVYCDIDAPTVHVKKWTAKFFSFFWKERPSR